MGLACFTLRPAPYLRRVGRAAPPCMHVSHQTNIMYALDDSHWGRTSSLLLNEAALGAPATWLSAWKHVYWKLLLGEPAPDVDDPHSVFVCGDNEEAKRLVMRIIGHIPGFKAVRVATVL